MLRFQKKGRAVTGLASLFYLKSKLPLHILPHGIHLGSIWNIICIVIKSEVKPERLIKPSSYYFLIKTLHIPQETNIICQN